MEHVGDHAARRRARRFSEIGGISRRMLTLMLRGLDRDGLVTRTVYCR
jgi:DNA-binding HxlR family transcriptional regulator